MKGATVKKYVIITTIIEKYFHQKYVWGEWYT